MDTKSLICFLQVCRDKSITRASRSLFISPQGLSKIIKNMETELNAPLFSRKNSGIQLTEYGEIVKKKAVQIMNCFEEMDQEIEKIRCTNSGKVRLASAYGVLNSLTPDCIFEFRKQFPNICLNYQEMSDNQTDLTVLQGNADLGFAIEPVTESVFDKKEILCYRLMLLVNKKNPLSHKERAVIADLKGQELILESKEYKIHKTILDQCRKTGFEPNIIFETSGFILCHKLCMQNKGITITVENMVSDLDCNEVKAIPFEENLFRKISMIWKKGKNPAPSVERFQQFIESWIQNRIES